MARRSPNSRRQRTGNSGAGLALDYLFAAWLSLPLLIFVALFFAAVVTWRAFFASRKMALGRVQRRALASAGLIAALGALAIAALNLPSLLAGSARAALCETTTFEQSVSPNGRYQASVIQVDCGAMSNFNRQVIVTRTAVGWASQSIMFFNGEPTVHLSWNGRLLIIQGQESPKSMPTHPLTRWSGVALWLAMSARRTDAVERTLTTGRRGLRPIASLGFTPRAIPGQLR